MTTTIQQLQMVWPERLLAVAPDVRLPAAYHLRTFADADTDAYLALMHTAGFTGWNQEVLATSRHGILPDGWLVIEHTATGELAATAMATHDSTDMHPYGGALGWVAGSPAHAGRGLGIAVCTAVIRRYIQAGYRRIYLRTDDWRLPALKCYLKMGFVPFLFAPDMSDRWQAICTQLQWPYKPKDWPSAPYVTPTAAAGV